MEHLATAHGSHRRVSPVSLRIEQTLLDFLLDEAKAKGVSLNSLISQILSSWTSWGRYAEKLNFVPLAKEVLREVFDSCKESTLASIARRTGQLVPREQTLFLCKQVTHATIIDYLSRWFSAFPAFERVDGSERIFVVRHEIGPKFTTFLSAYLQAVSETCVGGKLQIRDSTHNSIAWSYENARQASM